jgi:hypothetical protein
MQTGQRSPEILDFLRRTDTCTVSKPAIVKEVRAHEAELIALCRQPDFSLEKSRDALRKSKTWSAQPEYR